MNKNDRSAAFAALVKDYLNSGNYFEEADGDHRRWHELSPQAKLAYISRDAAMYDVPFEQFSDALQILFRNVSPDALLEASLRTVLGQAKEFHALAQLAPENSGTESEPLVDQFNAMLNSKQQQPVREIDTSHDRDI